MAHGDRNSAGRATDLVFHAQHHDGRNFHALCGRTGSIHNPANEGEEVTCLSCLKKIAKAKAQKEYWRASAKSTLGIDLS